MNKLTAMQELINHIGKNGVKKYPLVTLNLIQELLEKEKQQIIEAWLSADVFYNQLDAEQYYNETFKNTNNETK